MDEVDLNGLNLLNLTEMDQNAMLMWLNRSIIEICKIIDLVEINNSNIYKRLVLVALALLLDHGKNITVLGQIYYNLAYVI